MKNLEKFLESYEINLKYFDLEAFENEIMDIPYQIEVLEQNYDKLTDAQKKKFLELNKKLVEILGNIQAKNSLQEKILEALKESLKVEQEKEHIAAQNYAIGKRAPTSSFARSSVRGGTAGRITASTYGFNSIII
ncbi:hypothetical protein [Nitratiruptor tergarcus]|uniref:Uncharacterized protein n=1 Tax=Nitratiruptor tergarcus DSM 16512 TaxID=1069081 RepID=A0A1W1WSN0_9BACT|nr:hypothetical protein [Nitratiruptor tergarcus]SMC09209.1 hypothetical protein SAMN05660197_1014 [Nitratiruptor tergarcus DSM 16512]